MTVPDHFRDFFYKFKGRLQGRLRDEDAGISIFIPETGM